MPTTRGKVIFVGTKEMVFIKKGLDNNGK